MNLTDEDNKRHVKTRSAALRAIELEREALPERVPKLEGH